MTATRVAISLLVAGLAGLAPSACRRPAPPPALPPLSQELLSLARELGGGTPADEEAARAALLGLAARAEAELAKHPGAPPTPSLVATIFAPADAGGFAREVDDKDLRFVLLPSVLAARRGSCVGLGTLMLALAELVGVHARGVVAPGHFYVEVVEKDEHDDARWRRVELLKAGADLPDDWYRARYGTPGRPVSDREVLGVVAYDVGNQRRAQGRPGDALGAYARAVHDFPTFAEAHASMGATLQLLGALDEAAAAYRQARGLDPNLPGLEHNVELLEAELARRDGGLLSPTLSSPARRGGPN